MWVAGLAEGLIAMCPENPMTYVTLGSFHWMAYWLGPAQSRRESVEKGKRWLKKPLPWMIR